MPYNQKPGKVITPEAVAFPFEPVTPRRQAPNQVINALSLYCEPCFKSGQGIIPALQRSTPGREMLKGEGRLLSVVDDDVGRFRGHCCLSLARARARVYVCVISQKM